MRTEMTRNSYLSFDVNLAESLTSGGVEEGSGFAGQESNRLLSFLEQMLTVVVDNELSRINVGLKAEFLRDEP